MVHNSIAIEMSPQICLSLLFHNIPVVHLYKVISVHQKVSVVYLVLPGRNSDGIASGVVVSVTSQFEEGVDGEVVNLVHDLVGLDKITPYSSIL